LKKEQFGSVELLLESLKASWILATSARRTTQQKKKMGECVSVCVSVCVLVRCVEEEEESIRDPIIPIHSQLSTTSIYICSDSVRGLKSSPPTNPEAAAQQQKAPLHSLPAADLLLLNLSLLCPSCCVLLYVLHVLLLPSLPYFTLFTLLLKLH
jgi:hypothetical protein